MANLKEHLVAQIDFSRSMILKTLRDMPDEVLIHQPSPACPHALWIMGHFAATDDWLLGLIQAEPAALPPEYAKLFGYGTQTEPSAAAYPPVEEVRTQFMQMRERLMLWLASIDESRLDDAIDDGGIGFARTIGDALGKIAWHDGWHGGQLSTIRRSLGMDSIFSD